jgi:hypothetical protein
MHTVLSAYPYILYLGKWTYSYVNIPDNYLRVCFTISEQRWNRTRDRLSSQQAFIVCKFKERVTNHPVFLYKAYFTQLLVGAHPSS